MKKIKVSRQDFLNILMTTGAVAALSELSYVGFRFLSPRVTDGEFGGVFNVGHFDQFPPGSVTKVEAGRFYVVRLQDGGFLAIYQRCSHLGCSVPYEPAVQQFVCPCHGSAFSMEGDVLNDPAPRSLDLFPISILDTGEIEVDTSAPIQREHFDPAHVVYA